MRINLRKLAHLAAAGAVMLALSVVGSAYGAPQAREAAAIPGSFSSAVVVSNSGATVANVSMTFVKSDGTGALAAPLTFQVNPGASVNQYVPNIAGLADGRYAVLIDSDVPVTAIANLKSLSPSLSTSYNGIAQAATSMRVSVPQVFKSYVGLYTTSIVIQNAGSLATTATLTYTGSGTTVTEQKTIPANASVTVDNALTPGMPNGFSGSAVVTADQPLALIFMVSSTANQLAAGSGVAGGTTSVYLPALYNYYAGQYRSAIVVQNVDTVSTTVRVDYYDAATRALVYSETQGIAAGASGRPFLQFNAAAPGSAQGGLRAGFIGSAVVTSLEGKNIVAVVNMEQPNLGYLESYVGFPASTATSTANCASILNNYYNFNTFLTVQNVGAAATDVTITYKNPSGTTVSTKTVNLPANGVAGQYTPTQSGTAPGAIVYSAVVQGGAGSQIVAMVNQQEGLGLAGDVLQVYACSNS
ncbi:MAG TPA: hypothetical protein VGM69_14465 [Chloroflexota bacterium]